MSAAQSIWPRGVSAAGEFLITEDLREAAGDPADAAFVLLPPRRLK
jgi:hypothetical protein